MDIFLIVLILFVAVLLVLVVLAQNPKGGGLASNFGGAGSSQLMGVKKTGDLLEKLTWGFVIALIVLALSINIYLKPAEMVAPEETETEQPAAPQAPAQQAPTAPAPNPGK
jgi:preprotein translocase subunit SecG